MLMLYNHRLNFWNAAKKKKMKKKKQYWQKKIIRHGSQGLGLLCTKQLEVNFLFELSQVLYK